MPFTVCLGLLLTFLRCLIQWNSLLRLDIAQKIWQKYWSIRMTPLEMFATKTI